MPGCPRNVLTFRTSRRRSTVFNSSFNELTASRSDKRSASIGIGIVSGDTAGAGARFAHHPYFIG